MLWGYHRNSRFAAMLVVTLLISVSYGSSEVASAGHSYPSFIQANQQSSDPVGDFYTGDCDTLLVRWEFQSGNRQYTVRRYQNGVLYGIVYTGYSDNFYDTNLKTGVNYTYDVASYTTHWAAYSPQSVSLKTDCRGYHYGPQQTTVGGWKGVRGDITSANPTLRGSMCDQHSISWLGMYNGGKWVQAGWWKGNGNAQEPCTNGAVLRYIEWKGLSFEPGGLPSYNFSYISQPQTAGESHHYQIYQCEKYNDTLYRVCIYVDYLLVAEAYASSGVGYAQAEGEVYNSSIIGNDMGLSWYGTASNLQIMGASGWELWDASLISGGTLVFDQRPNYYISHANKYYKHKVCGPNNC